MREVVNQVWLLTTKVAAGLLVFLAFWLASMVLDKTIRRIYNRTDLSKRYAVNLLGQIFPIPHSSPIRSVSLGPKRRARAASA